MPIFEFTLRNVIITVVLILIFLPFDVIAFLANGYIELVWAALTYVTVVGIINFSASFIRRKPWILYTFIIILILVALLATNQPQRTIRPYWGTIAIIFIAITQRVYKARKEIDSTAYNTL